MTDNFWTAVLSAGEPGQLGAADGAAYRRERRAVSSSRIYDEELYLLPEQRAQQRPRSIYVAVDNSLESYASHEVASKWAQGPAESDENYLARTNGLLRHLDQLPQSDQELITATRQAIAERAVSPDDAWKQHRQVVDNRAAGLSGQQQLGNRAPHGGLGGGEQQLAYEGGLGPEPVSNIPAGYMSSSAVAQIVREREAARQGQQPQRQAMPTGSSGEGWL